jgi:hypothetical protein
MLKRKELLAGKLGPAAFAASMIARRHDLQDCPVRVRLRLVGIG